MVKGLRRNGGHHYGGLSTPNYFGQDQKVATWAVAVKNMEENGFGFFPPDFEPPSFKSKTYFKYVGEDYSTVTTNYTCYKLASREELKLSSFNHFSRERQPLPR